jgi:predicted transcriptional regulator
MFERTKTVRTLDRVATVIGSTRYYIPENSIKQ